MSHYHFWQLQITSIGRLAYVQDPEPFKSKSTAWRHGKACGHQFIVMACTGLC